MIDRGKIDGEVVRGDKSPSFEPVLNAEIEEVVDFFGAIAVNPGNSAADIARGCGHQVPPLFNDPDGNTAATQTAHDAEGAVVRSHEQSAGDTISLLGKRRSGFGQNRDCGGGGQVYYWGLMDFTRPRIPRVRVRVAKSAPATNFISGPKLQAAGAPRK